MMVVGFWVESSVSLQGSAVGCRVCSELGGELL